MKPGAKNKPTLGSFNDDWVIDICRLLNEIGADYVVIGGAACNLHGLIRATKDIDLLIPKEVCNTTKILEVLSTGLAFGLANELDPADVTKNPVTIIGDTPRVDLLTVACKVKYTEAAQDQRTTMINGVSIRYASLETLVKTKQTDRLQDRADIERLQQLAKNKSRRR